MNQTHQITHSGLRRSSLQYLTLFTPQSCDVSRISLFLAVSILDKFICFLKKKGPNQLHSKAKALPVALACLRLATRYLGEKLPNTDEIKSVLKWDGDFKALKARWSETQLEVFMEIKFVVPKQTAFGLFEEAATNDESFTRSMLAGALKFLLCAIRYSAELSLKPEYGPMLYEYQLGNKTTVEFRKYVLSVNQWSSNHGKILKSQK